MIASSAKHAPRAGAPGRSVDVVIVNWNSRELLRKCLAALAESTCESLRVIVVDNASTDGSADCLESVGANVQVLVNPENLGFAAACNRGAAQGSAPYLLFLNPDVRVRPQTVERAIGHLDDPANARVGIVGVQLLDSDGRVSRSCARAPTVMALLLRAAFIDRLAPRLVPSHFMTEWDHRETREVDQVLGACLVIRRSLFERLGGFDERFFLYYEDVDLCVAARESGCKVVYFADAQAHHLGGGTTIKIADRRLFYLLRSRVLFAAKRHGRLVALGLVALTATLEISLRFLHSAIVSSRHGARTVLSGGAMFWRDVLPLMRRVWLGH